MQPETSLADFEALVRRAGLTLTQAQIAEMYRGWFYVEGMLKRLRAPRGREAEPAHVFVPEQGA